MSNRLVLLQQDLRLRDNPALYWACQPTSAIVYVFYGLCQSDEAWWGSSAKKAFARQKALQSLQSDLAERRMLFWLRELEDSAAYVNYLVRWISEHRVESIYLNASHIPAEIERVKQLRARLPKVAFQCYRGNQLFDFGAIQTQGGDCFKKFTPFAHCAQRHLLENSLHGLPAPGPLTIHPQTAPDFVDGLSALSKRVTEPCDTRFACEEAAAQKQLKDFLKYKVGSYVAAREIPRQEGTSYLSIPLSLGILGVRDVVLQLLNHQPKLLRSELRSSGEGLWLLELLWREFYRHLLFAEPRLFNRRKAWLEWTDAIHWHTNEAHLLAWKKGETGFPLVDAAMRQLNELGWMHNRLRMVVASFLTKQLGIDWRAGEDYFLERLIDSDWASNNGGWQWSASTGTDAQPYFRVFNPTLQLKHWDPEGLFVRQWIPTLQSVPTQQLLSLPVSGYVHPVIENSVAAQAAKRRFEAAKKRVESNGRCPANLP